MYYAPLDGSYGGRPVVAVGGGNMALRSSGCPFPILEVQTYSAAGSFRGALSRSGRPPARLRFLANMFLLTKDQLWPPMFV